MKNYYKPSIELIAFDNNEENMAFASGNYNNVNIIKSDQTNVIDFQCDFEKDFELKSYL